MLGLIVLAIVGVIVWQLWIREPAARAAWDDLELHHELKLSFGEEWRARLRKEAAAAASR